jgi:membrane peptidoglycan carboxypeptidase
VRAIYGGDGKRSRNAAAQDYIRAGSTFKLFALLAGLEGEDHTGEHGISLDSRFNAHSPYKYKSIDLLGSTVSNFGNEFGGKGEHYIDLRTATKESVNTVFAQLNEEVNPKRTKAAALRAGIPEKDADGNEIVGTEFSNTLGNAAVTVEDLASAYGTVAAGGKHAKPYVIDRIVRPDGEVVYRHNSAPERQFTEGVCADAVSALQGVVKPGGTGAYAGGKLDRPIAGKTGTVGVTASRRTKAAWFVGFTPQLVTAVAIHRLSPTGGQDDVTMWRRNSTKKDGRDMQGGMYPVQVWTEYMQNALKGAQVIEFPPPANVGERLGPAAPVETQPADPSPSGDPSADPNAPQSPDPNAPPTGDPNNPVPSGSPTGGGNGGGGGATGPAGGGDGGGNTGGANPPGQGGTG